MEVDAPPPPKPVEWYEEAPERAPELQWEGHEKFQIGPNHQCHRYSETKFQNIAQPPGHNAPRPWPVYQCRRGTEGWPHHVLFLYRTKSGPWLAVESPRDAPDPINDAQGRPKFITARADLDDVLKYAWNEWRIWQPEAGTGGGRWSKPKHFCTKVRPQRHGDAAAGPAARASSSL